MSVTETIWFPRVSIVVAVRNMEETIGRCIESLINLDYPDKEIIVVDDGSTDQTPTILQRYPIRMLRIENSGVSAARNAGIEIGNGEIVAFTDGDCYAERAWLDRLVRRFQDPTTGGVGGYVDFEREGVIAAAISIEYEERLALRQKSTQSIACINAAFRRDALLLVGKFRRISGELVGGEDIDLSYRIREKGFSLAYDSEAIVHHDGKEMSRGLLKRNFRNAVVSMAIFRNHKIAWRDPFFGWSLKAQPLIFALCLISAALAFLLGSSFWGVFMVPSILWHFPLGVKTARVVTKPLALVVVPLVFFVRSAILFGGAVWGILKLLSSIRFDSSDIETF